MFQQGGKNKDKNVEDRMREYLERFALERGLDPLLPQTWKSIPFRIISQTKVIFIFIL